MVIGFIGGISSAIILNATMTDWFGAISPIGTPVTISAVGMLVPLSVKLFGSNEVPSGIRSVKITFVALTFPLFVIVTE
ncbi:putative membrane protein [Bacillus cereus]|nr:putative membrane protein [Bacillus cereus]